MEILQGSTVQGHLVAAYRTPVSRIKGKDHALSFKIGQLQFLIGRGIQFKVGGGNSFSKYHDFLECCLTRINVAIFRGFYFLPPELKAKEWLALRTQFASLERLVSPPVSCANCTTPRPCCCFHRSARAD